MLELLNELDCIITKLENCPEWEEGYIREELLNRLKTLYQNLNNLSI